MSIQVELSLATYSQEEIIEFIENGVVSLDEVVESGVAHTFFTNSLLEYIRQALKKQELNELDEQEPTIICPESNENLTDDEWIESGYEVMV